ncbi:phage tail tube protein [Lysobacter fragariae]
MALKSQLSKLWYMTAGGALIRIQCFKNLTGLGGSRDQAETTCLDKDVREYIAGLITPGTAQFSIDPDPTYLGHKELHALYKAGTKVDWALGLSDGTSAPSTTQGVKSIAVTSGGTGYTSVPGVTFTGGVGTGAAATAVVENGVVVAIEVTNAGTGYTSAPAVGFTGGGGGSGAAATATLKYMISAPADRTFLLFNGYVSDYPFDLQPGAPVTSQISVQLSDLITPAWKA